MSVQIKGVGTIGGIDEGLNTVGVITATSFSGSGANLTNLPAQATIANNADNRVITGGSGVNLNGEANLTFNGQKLNIVASDGGTDVKFAVRNTNANGYGAYISGGGNNNQYILRLDDKDQNEYFRVSGIGHVGILNGNPQRRLHIGNSGNAESNIRLQGGADYFEMRVKDSDNAFSIHRNIASGGSSEALRIRSSSEISFGGSGYAGQPLTLHSTNPNLGYMITTDTNRGVMSFRDANSTQNIGFGCIGNNHVFMKDGTERLRITSSGEIKQYGFTGSVDAGSDDLVIGNTDSGTNRGMTIWSHSNQNGGIAFADNDSNYRGAIQYQHAQDRFRFLAEGEEVGMWSNQRGLMVGPTNYGDSVTSKGGAKLYHLCGATPFDGSYNSSTMTPIMRCGHSFNGTMTIWMAFNGDNFHRGTRQMIYHCQGTYGYVGLHIKSQYNHNALGAGLNSLALHYQNSGSPNYYLQVNGTWASGQSDVPYLLWSWTGHNSEYPYAL